VKYPNRHTIWSRRSN